MFSPQQALHHFAQHCCTNFTWTQGVEYTVTPRQCRPYIRVHEGCTWTQAKKPLLTPLQCSLGGLHLNKGKEYNARPWRCCPSVSVHWSFIWTQVHDTLLHLEDVVPEWVYPGVSLEHGCTIHCYTLKMWSMGECTQGLHLNTDVL